MNDKYKNSYKATDKELVSLSVYNVGYQRCDANYQWGPGIRDHYLIHYIISGKGTYKIGGSIHTLKEGDAFLVYPNTEVVYQADETDPWEYAWVGFTGSDAAMILQATDFSKSVPYIHNVKNGNEIKRQLLHIYDARGNGFEHAVEMTGRLYTTLALFIQCAHKKETQNSANTYVQKSIEYISANYSYPITVEDIASYVGLSRSHLFRSFTLFVCLMVISYKATKTVVTSAKVGDRELPIYCVDTTEKKVALSFDAAWGAEDFPRIMDTLDKHKVKVTFFMTGGWVEDNPDCVKELVKRGHDLGNHSEHHYDMTTISQSEKESELKSVHDKVKELTGYEMFLFSATIRCI